jgi:sigma-B regulation protein RsbU (phosphoserine phosphatase)
MVQALAEAGNTLSKGISLLEEISVLVDRQNEDRRISLYQELQRKINRHKIPVRPEVSVEFFLKPKLGIHSDYIDYFPLGNSEFLLIHGEVTGKGFNAVLTLTVLKALLNVLAAGVKHPGEILNRMNRVVSRFLFGEFFSSLTILLINLESHTLEVSKAGHGGVFQTSTLQKFSSGSVQEQFPLGTHKEYRYKSETFQIHSGDVWALYSDGLVETANTRGELYGINRLQTRIQMHKFLEAKQILEKVKEDLHEFKGEKPFMDDVSLVIVKFR